MTNNELDILNKVIQEKRIVEEKLRDRVKEIEQQVLTITTNYRSKLEKCKAYPIP